MDRWPHQIKGREDFHASVAKGERRICLTTPTGGGKSITFKDIAKDYLDQFKRVVLYLNKKMLTTQAMEVFDDDEIDYGLRVSGYGTNQESNLQVASMQTEHSQVKRQKKRELHKADLVVVDECHEMCGPTQKVILNQHHDEGAVILGITATPLDIGDMYDHLIVAGTTSELRACDALVPALHYAPDSPDYKAFKLNLENGQDVTKSANIKAIMTPTIFARVGKWYQKLNPGQTPTILYGPGVRESLWFAEQFWKFGITAGHIDGDDVWINGKFYRSSPDARKDLAEGSKDGSIKVVCNRMVLRTGVNWPWIQHLIFAYVIGSLTTYLQIGGRGLRAYPGKEFVTIQDHGDAWLRHGSLNQDRHWDLNYTNGMVSAMRADSIRAKVEKEPWRCPECGMVLTRAYCKCGFIMPPKKSRPVVQVDGTLREMVGDTFRPHRQYKKPDGPELWKRMYYRSKNVEGGRTFRAAFTLYASENEWGYPDPSWPLMPKDPMDNYRLVESVPRENLND